MTTVKDHYDKHLASCYSWLFGDFETKTQEFEALFKSLEIHPTQSKVAIDLGAGSGFQAIPLARLGYSVTAIDFSRVLIRELEERKGNLPIHTLEADILHFNKYTGLQPELVVCMVDTLLHLDSKESIKKLLANAYKELAKDGKIILSFRELAHDLKDEQRFVPVRSDENRIFTCFLEYHPTYVKVYDIVHQKEDGKWTQKISSYKKLKVSANQVAEWITKEGFTIEYNLLVKGFSIVVGKK